MYSGDIATPKQITIRSPPPELVERLRELSRQREESLNATILHVLQQALGINSRRRWLEAFATWTEAEAEEFEAALRAQREIDGELWQ